MAGYRRIGNDGANGAGRDRKRWSQRSSAKLNTGNGVHDRLDVGDGTRQSGDDWLLAANQRTR